MKRNVFLPASFTMVEQSQVQICNPPDVKGHSRFVFEGTTFVQHCKYLNEQCYGQSDYSAAGQKTNSHNNLLNNLIYISFHYS